MEQALQNETRLISWQELEQLHGSYLYELDEMAASIGMNRTTLNQFFIKYKDELDGILFMVGVHLERHPRTHAIKYALPKSYFDELIMKIAEKQNQDAQMLNPARRVSDAFVSIRFQIPLNDFRKRIEQGFLHDVIVEQKENGKGGTIYIFDKKKVMSHTQYMTISEMVTYKRFDKKNFGYGTLYRWVEQGKLIQPSFLKGTNLYDVEDVKRQADILLEEGFKKKSTVENTIDIQHLNKYDVLHKSQQKLIDDYLEHRLAGYPIVFESQVYKKSMQHDREHMHRTMVANIMFKMILGRNGIKYQPNLKREILDNGYNPNDFDMSDFNLNDMISVSKCHKVNAFNYNIQNFWKPFVYWYLMKMEEKLDEDNDEQWVSFRKMRKRFLNALNYIPAFQEESEIKPKTFLAREQVLLTLQSIRNAFHGYEAIIKTTQFAIGVFMGLRPKELIHLEINDFWLDENGLLAKDQDGYGRLRLPAEKSKQKKFPSPRFMKEDEWGNLVVPMLVEQINLYLQSYLYQHQSERGKGYLFRPIEMVHLTHIKYQNGNTLARWITDLRPYLTFLPDDKKMAFRFYDTRHTTNELIDATYIASDGRINSMKTEIAECHMRHKGQKSVSTGKRAYRDQLAFEDYKKGISHTLAFPWDMEGLIRWETEKGYRDLDKQLKDLTDRRKADEHLQLISESREEQKQKHRDELQQIQDEYNELKKAKPDDMPWREWMSKMATLEDQMRFKRELIRKI